MTDASNDQPAPPDTGGQPRSAHEIRADIEQTRQEMGETVEALAAKTDVKAQAQERVAAAKAQAQERVETAKTQAQERADAARSAVQRNPRRPVMIAGAVAAVVIAVWLLRR